MKIDQENPIKVGLRLMDREKLEELVFDFIMNDTKGVDGMLRMFLALRKRVFEEIKNSVRNAKPDEVIRALGLRVDEDFDL